jgi:16S rRNA (cytosine1402-N4)-methyltransferase
MSKPSHIPVLAKEALELLDPQPNDILVDATVGLGGHAALLADKLGPQGRLIGIDQDEQALRIANDNLTSFNDRVVLVRGNFRNLDKLVENAGYQSVDGILLDLGFSSLQIETGERGFSFLHNAPLDMRMDATGQGQTAAEIANHASFNELVEILREYGEEPKAESIAKRMLEFRKKRPIETTYDLVEIVGGNPGKIHPATRVFQALRIATNQELAALNEVLPKAIELLAPGGRLAVISFHSLEDRIVKNFFKNKATGGRIELLSKKAIQPSWEERKRNPRARSAKMRGIKKL